MPAYVPQDEAARLEALQRYDILDSEPQEEFDDLARLAQEICDTPIAVVSIIDKDRQWLKAKVGLDICETPRSHSFCTHAIEQNELLIVPDAMEDPRFRNNPVVTGDPGVRFYAGMPILTPDGHALGAVAVVAMEPRVLTLRQQRALEALARQASALLELRRSARRMEMNIGELSHLHASLHEGEERLRLALGSARMATLDWDIRGGRLTSSRELALIFGKSDTDWNPTSDELIACVHPEDRLRMQTAFNRASIAGAGYDFELRCLWPDGSEHWFASAAEVFFSPDGSPVRMVGVVQDITERKQISDAARESQEALRDSEARFNTFMENCPMMAYIKDEQGRYVYANASFERLHQLRQNQYMGYTALDLMPWEIGSVVHGKTLQALQSDVPTEGILKIETPQGMREIAAHQFTFRDSLGRKFLGCIGLDVTQQQRIEQERLVYMGQVEEARRLAEQQAEVLERQTNEIVQARDQALASTRAKSEFLANMSHEIRTPMNGIMGMIEMLTNTPMSVQQENYAKTIRHSADMLLTIINDILDFSKIEAGKLVIESAPFDLKEAMDEVVALLLPRAQEKELELTCRLPEDFPTYVLGDSVRVRQILTNLVGNAVKFTSTGSVRIGAQLLEETQDNIKLRLFVNDTGVGIPEESRARIFNSFTQADGSITRKYGGTGLGLTICRQLIALMGGEIGVDSKIDEGSSFWLVLTLPKAVEVKAFTLPRKLDGLRVLIVDRREEIREPLCKQLKSWGCRVDSAMDSFECLEKLVGALAQGESYKLVMIDSQTLAAEGASLAMRIGVIAQRDGTLLSLTGCAEAPDEFRSLPIVGCVGRISRAATIYDSILEWFGVSESNESEVKAPPPPVEDPLVGMKILLAEDNIINQTVATNLLAHWGCIVEVVGNGRAALNATEHKLYDAVLMDVQMPEMDGLVATTQIRRREYGTGRHQTIIAMTAHNMTGDRELCLSIGMDDYTSKPVSPKELQEVLIRWRNVSQVSEPEGEETAEEITIGHTTPMFLDVIEEAEAEPDAAIGAGEDAGGVSASGKPTLDLDCLHRYCNGIVTLERQIIEKFLELLPGNLERIQTACAASDIEQLRIEAHTLKGSSRALGAEALAEACSETETAARAGDAKGAVDLVTQIAREGERLLPVLEKAFAERNRKNAA